LMIHPDADLSGVAMSDVEHSVLKAIKTGDATLRSLVERAPGEEEAVNAFIYTLAITRQFGYRGQAKKPPMSPAGRPSTRARNSEPTPASVVKPRGAASTVPDQTGANSEPPSWNSARLSAIPSAPGSVIPSRGGQVPDAPDESRAAAPGDAIERALEADDAYRRALDLTRRGELELAKVHALRALELDTENPDYVAINAWLGASSGEPDAIEHSIQRLTDALRGSPGCQTAMLFRARLYRKVNRLNEALQDFEAVLRLNPSNREANSEARSLRDSLAQ